jgi:hypothetical protein
MKSRIHVLTHVDRHDGKKQFEIVIDVASGLQGQIPLAERDLSNKHGFIFLCVFAATASYPARSYKALPSLPPATPMTVSTQLDL